MYMDNFAGALISFVAICCIVVAGATYGVTYLSRKKEMITTKPIVPERRLVTDGKKVDTVYVYKIN